MVRQSRQTPEQKKDAHKKKAQHHDKSSPKKPSDAAVWPCSINGCNKQFAREADLKRHQRTTKLHSVPGFACPQCDARFTRTDALRRHQKSRHNGVVIDSTDAVDRRKSMGDEDSHSPGSRSHSRSGTPSSKENPTPTPLPPSNVSPGGPQSYYRQHTFAGVMVSPSGLVVDGHYPSPAGLPASATRLHQATWNPPPWASEASQPSPHMIHPGYPHPYYNAPPQYYRPGMMQPPDAVAHQQIPNGITSSSSSRQGSPVIAVDPSLDHAGMEDTSEAADHEPVVIDPSLVSPSASSAGNRQSSMDGRRVPKTRSPPGCTQRIPSPSRGDLSNGDSSGTDSEASIVRHLLSPTQDHHYPSPHSASLQHSLEMEQILTEDGEPMLNPAELLTQESLASPPPS